MNYYEDAYAAVRAHLPRAKVFVGDGFNARNFNRFWTGQVRLPFLGRSL